MLPPKSPLLLARESSALVVVDLQVKLLPAILDAPRVVWNTGRLVQAAQLFGVPVFASEQYPEGLGGTVPDVETLLQAAAATRYTKRAFSCRECQELPAQLAAAGRHQIVLCGIETHVCVLQTALDLISENFDVFLVADASSSRAAGDREIALRRLESQGVQVVTAESAMFEWCDTSAADGFRELSRLVKQSPPAAPGAAP